MAEYNKTKFYWIKLTDRFMTSDTVDFLMSQKDGANYVVLYQMLCLKSVNNDGVLARQIGEMLIPFDEEKIARDCKWFSIDTVRIALGLYRRLGLIYENTNGVLAISDFSRLIGSQTYGAERRQIQRSGDICHPDCHPEIKRLRDKDIRDEDIRDKDNITTTTTNNTYPSIMRGAFSNKKVNDFANFDEYLESDEFKFHRLVSSMFADFDCKIALSTAPQDFIVYNKARDWLGIGGELIVKDEDTLHRYVEKWATTEIAKRGDKE